MEFISALVSQLKNPWQYICIGVVWTLMLKYSLDDKYLVPSVLVSLGTGYLVPNVLNLIKRTIIKFHFYILSRKMLKILIDCTAQEKNFLINRVYENGNELGISMHNEPYFYKESRDDKGNFEGFVLYKREFNTKEKVGIFLRGLEKKGILKNGGNQSMIMPLWVWNVLIKNADKCLERFNGKK